MTTRRCNACGTVKPIETGFYRRTSRGKSGFGHTCKECSKVRSRAQHERRTEARDAGPLVSRRLMRRGAVLVAKTCPTCHVLKDADAYPRDTARAGGRYPVCNACRSRGYAEDEQARERAKAASRRSRARNGRTDYGVRKARKYGVGFELFTARDLWDSYAERDLFRCVYCDGPYEHDDHVLPLSRGGAHAIYNLVPACAECNTRKQSRTPIEWFRAR